MRQSLSKLEGERKKFTARFVRFGRKVNFKGHSEETILLRDVQEAETKKKVTDHIWFAYTRAFEKVKLEEGCEVEFFARVKAYKKGYVNKRYGVDKSTADFKLSHPTQVRRIDPKEPLYVQ